ncbi:MAG: LysE family translocator [Alphaproteobacteria bacterium]|nr:LysE family translocator [Alphaproteobacteria bacterium]
MTDLPLLAAFVGAAALLTITPGVDTALVLRTAVAGGARAAWFAALGIGVGCLAWAGLVSLGVAALMKAAPLAFEALKWAGAAYLAFLGLSALFRPRSEFSLGETDQHGSAFRRGLLTNILNPKVGVFYISFLPQFIPAGADVAMTSFALAGVHVGLSVLWFGALIAATAPLGRVLQRPGTVRALDRLTGVVFLGFGVKLALSRA